MTGSINMALRQEVHLIQGTSKQTLRVVSNIIIITMRVIKTTIIRKIKMILNHKHNLIQVKNMMLTKINHIRVHLAQNRNHMSEKKMILKIKMT